MTENQTNQWVEIASKFEEAAKEQKSVLAYHYDAFNRGWIGGLQLGRQKALMFAHSSKTDSSLIPAELQSERNDEELFDVFIEFLVNEVSVNIDELDQDRIDANYEMNEMEEFRDGRLTGLKDWKTTGRF
jgi:hypothetical protein